MSPLWGSNPRPYAYEAHALPAELKRLTTLALLQKYKSLPCNLARLDCFKLGIAHAGICSFLCFGWCLLGGAVLPEGQEAAAGKGQKLSKKLLGFLDFFLCFFRAFLGFRRFAAFRAKPFETQAFCFTGIFCFDVLFLGFSRFFRLFFCCFLGFRRFAAFRAKPFETQAFCFTGIFCFDVLFLGFSRFFRLFFCCFLGFRRFAVFRANAFETQGLGFAGSFREVSFPWLARVVAGLLRVRS